MAAILERSLFERVLVFLGMLLVSRQQPWTAAAHPIRASHKTPAEPKVPEDERPMIGRFVRGFKLQAPKRDLR